MKLRLYSCDMETKYREQIMQIKTRLERSEISYDEAKVLAAPIIEEINKKARAIAKKYNKRLRYLNVSVCGFNRSIPHLQPFFIRASFR